MFEFQPISDKDPTKFFDELGGEIEGMLDRAWFTNLANASAAIMAQMPRLNWAGFYLAHGETLFLGPFQGLPACLQIPFNKGVCGEAARTRQTLRVEDVHAFPGHIACDARSRSELVIPMIYEGRLLGVLDLDSPEPSRFSAEDQEGLEKIVAKLVAGTDWPASFL
jgi:L-methionine (R)-S-oxide reductase